jgi:hypothetical protein
MRENLFVYEKSPPYPPYFYLAQIADHCPKALSTYLDLWRRKDDENKLNISKHDIRNEYLKTLTRFKNDCMLLAKECLINVDESPNFLSIELVGWEDELC